MKLSIAGIKVLEHFSVLGLGPVYKDKTRQDKTRQDLFYSAQFYRTFRLKLQRQLNTVQLRNKRKKKNVTIN